MRIAIVHPVVCLHVHLQEDWPVHQLIRTPRGHHAPHTPENYFERPPKTPCDIFSLNFSIERCALPLCILWCAYMFICKKIDLCTNWFVPRADIMLRTRPKSYFERPSKTPCDIFSLNFSIERCALTLCILWCAYMFICKRIDLCTNWFVPRADIMLRTRPKNYFERPPKTPCDIFSLHFSIERCALPLCILWCAYMFIFKKIDLCANWFVPRADIMLRKQPKYYFERPPKTPCDIFSLNFSIERCA